MGSDGCRESAAAGGGRRRRGGSAGLEDLRMGWSGGREALWRSRIGPAGRLTGVVPRRLGSGSSRGARMREKGVL